MKSIKRIIAGLVATTMALSAMCIGASADYVSYTTGKTSGGSNGYVTIKSGIYKNLYEPSGGVHVMQYGAKSEILYAPTVTIYYTLSGTLYKNGSYSPVNFYDSGNKHSISYLNSTTNYDSCYEKTTATSSAFGSKTLERNSNF